MNLVIPSPPISFFQIGPITIHIYALCLITGMLVGGWLAQRRFVKRGGDSEQFQAMLLWAIVLGIIGARLYHVITDYELYFGPGKHPIDALKIWNGGLGIWGGVAFGGLAVWLYTRSHNLNFASVADVIAPGLLIGQGIGRLGNWFNQELFGKPLDAPWALSVDPQYRPSGYEDIATFHPTFAYEMVWNFLGAAVLIWAEKKFKLGRGKVFACYVLWYTLGRFFIESLRIDPAHVIGGLRINNYTSMILFIAAAIWLVVSFRRAPGYRLWPFNGFPTKIGHQLLDVKPQKKTQH